MVLKIRCLLDYIIAFLLGGVKQNNFRPWVGGASKLRLKMHEGLTSSNGFLAFQIYRVFSFNHQQVLRNQNSRQRHITRLVPRNVLTGAKG